MKFSSVLLVAAGGAKLFFVCVLEYSRLKRDVQVIVILTFLILFFGFGF